MPVEYKPFDISEYLESGEMIAGFLSAAAEDEDSSVLMGALAHAAKARGRPAAGLSRESLCKALKPGAHPRFEMVQAVLRELGVKLAVAARNGTDETRKMRLPAFKPAAKGILRKAHAGENVACKIDAAEAPVAKTKASTAARNPDARGRLPMPKVHDHEANNRR